jgi:hypothetical protein
MIDSMRGMDVRVMHNACEPPVRGQLVKLVKTQACQAVHPKYLFVIGAYSTYDL